jgi:transposase InsO family protein
MSRRGNCYDNAMAENFSSILKTECIYRHKIATLSEARQLIDGVLFPLYNKNSKKLNHPQDHGVRINFINLTGN